MMQTIEIKLAVEDLLPSKQPAFVAKLSRIFQDTLCAEIEFTDLSVSEAYEVLSELASRETMREALEQISQEPLWGETDTIDIESAKATGEWQDGAYFPSPITESERLSRVITIAREAIKKLDHELGADSSKPVYAIAESITPKTPGKQSTKQEADAEQQTRLFE